MFYAHICQIKWEVMWKYVQQRTSRTYQIIGIENYALHELTTLQQFQHWLKSFKEFFLCWFKCRCNCTSAGNTKHQTQPNHFCPTVFIENPKPMHICWHYFSIIICHLWNVAHEIFMVKFTCAGVLHTVLLYHLLPRVPE